MKLSELAKELPGARLEGDAEISSLCEDSRLSGAGDLFFCYRGTRADSHIYAREAEARGAAAVVCERETGVKIPQLFVPDGRRAMTLLSAAFYGHPERKLKIVGVTGTNGKTTVTHMLCSVLGAAGVKAGLVGTLGARYGKKTVAPALTTPDPAFLYSLLADMAKCGTETVAMEISAHALALGKDEPIVYEAGIFTNLTQDHLDFFGTMEEYGAAKRKMFVPGRCRFAVLNADDPFGRKLAREGLPCATYGVEEPADCFAVTEEETLRGSRVLFNFSDELCEAELRLTGRHNVYNALAAGVAARHLGVSVEEIARGLSSMPPVDGRLERAATFRGADVFVDFAHTPDGLEKSLLALKPHCRGKLVLLFGCGGNRDRGKRPIMGETAAKYADFTVITSDNPRYEDPCAVIAEIEAGFCRRSRAYAAVEDREKATEYALSLLERGDVLLVAGKGGETTQEIMGIKYAYNDKAVIKTLIGKLKQ